MARLYADAIKAWKAHVANHGSAWTAVANAGGSVDDYNEAVRDWYMRERELADEKAGTFDGLVAAVEEENVGDDTPTQVGELDVRSLPGEGQTPGMEDGL